jgi:hypothetical protein
MKVVVLDEFGHDGMYLSRDHKNYHSSPVFGYSGFVIPAINIFTFISGFVDLKSRTPKCANHRHSPIATEIKGIELFQRDTFARTRHRNQRRNSLRLALTLFELIKSCEGQLIYYGLEKYVVSPDRHNAKGMHVAVAKSCLELSERYCEAQKSRFVMLLDEHSAHKERQSAVADIIFSKYLERWWLAEPPFEAGSYFSNLVQAADWTSALIGRIWAYRTRPQEWEDLKPYHDLFEGPVRGIVLDGSTVKPPPLFQRQ